jgi:prefoldin subunit 5
MLDGISEEQAITAQRLYDRSVTELHQRLSTLKTHYKELEQVSRTLVCSQPIHRLLLSHFFAVLFSLPRSSSSCARLQSRIEKETRHDIMVPMGPLAFMPGYLHHTNEVSHSFSAPFCHAQQ